MARRMLHPTEGILPCWISVELPGTRTCCRSREGGIFLHGVDATFARRQRMGLMEYRYRNLQMLLSALIPLCPVTISIIKMCSLLVSVGSSACVPIPSLRDLQECFYDRGIGLDPAGAHYNGVIVGKVDEFGAVEVQLHPSSVSELGVWCMRRTPSRRLWDTSCGATLESSGM
jgi:hypothetical protein